MTDLKVSLDIVSGSFEQSILALQEPVATAATKAMTATGLQLKAQGRAAIARSGFSLKWQNALRVEIYPKLPEVSMSPAVYLHHNIEYAGIFEDGATIGGHPFMWLPLSNAPKRIGRFMTTPALFEKSVAPLVSLTSRNGKALLGAPIRLSKAQAGQAVPKVTLAGLRRGKSGKGILRTVPLFVGIPETSIRGRFNIRELCATLRDNIPALYRKNLDGG